MALGLGPVGVAIGLYGAGNGVFSIAKGTLPLALFGPECCAPLIGRLARPSLIAHTARKFTICRAGPEWAVRDATGAVSGLSPTMADVCETADRMAKRTSTTVALTDEARIYLNSIGMAHRYRLPCGRFAPRPCLHLSYRFPVSDV